jgi:hypothetical protein
VRRADLDRSTRGQPGSDADCIFWPCRHRLGHRAERCYLDPKTVRVPHMHGCLILRVQGNIGSASNQLALDQLVAIAAEVATVEESNVDVFGLDLRSCCAEALLSDQIADHARADPPVRRADLPDGLEHVDEPRRAPENRAQLGGSRGLNSPGAHSHEYGCRPVRSREWHVSRAVLTVAHFR